MLDAIIHVLELFPDIDLLLLASAIGNFEKSMGKFLVFKSDVTTKNRLIKT